MWPEEFCAMGRRHSRRASCIDQAEVRHARCNALHSHLADGGDWPARPVGDGFRWPRWPALHRLTASTMPLLDDPLPCRTGVQGGPLEWRSFPPLTSTPKPPFRRRKRGWCLSGRSWSERGGYADLVCHGAARHDRQKVTKAQT